MAFEIDHPMPAYSLAQSERLVLRLDDGTIVRVCEMSHEQMYALLWSRLHSKHAQWCHIKHERFDDKVGRYFAVLELERANDVELPIVQQRVNGYTRCLWETSCYYPSSTRQ